MSVIATRAHRLLVNPRADRVRDYAATGFGRILSLGFIRLRSAKSTPLSADFGDSCLDFPPRQRRHAEERGRSGRSCWSVGQ